MKKLILVLMFLFQGLAMAADGSSGCGPGWFVLKKNSLVSSSLRATTNGILMPTTTIGMTLGTSNCSKHDIVKNEQKSLHFVTQNYFELKAEMAKGQGEFIDSFAHTVGCSANSQALLKSELKGSYREIFSKSSATAEEVLGNIYKTIFSRNDLAKSCLSV
jgi:hypothetical protein